MDDQARLTEALAALERARDTLALCLDWFRELKADRRVGYVTMAEADVAATLRFLRYPRD